MRPSLSQGQFALMNGILFQLVWWASVLWENIAIPFSVLVLVIHFYLSSTPKADCRLMLSLGLLGILMDSLLTLGGVFEFNQIPIWLALLWLHFSLTLRASLAFFIQLPTIIQALLGAIFGPLSYVAGAHFHAVFFPLEKFETLLVLALCWAIILPVGAYLAKR